MTKLALLATGGSLRQAPFKDPSFTWWGVAQLVGKVPRLDRVFEIHDEQTARDEGTWALLRHVNGPIVLDRAHPDFPTSESYPYADVDAALTVDGRDEAFVQSTVSHMLAYALVRPPPPAEIHLFGADMVHGTEHGSQRPSCEFLIGVAFARGIRVVLSPLSDLLKARYRYGRDERKRRVEVVELEERLRQMRERRDQASANEEIDHALRLKYDALVADAEYFLKRANL